MNHTPRELSPNKKAVFEIMMKYHGAGFYIPFEPHHIDPAIRFMLKNSSNSSLSLRIVPFSDSGIIIYAETSYVTDYGTNYQGANNFFCHEMFQKENGFKNERFVNPKHGSILWYVEVDELEAVLNNAVIRAEDIERVETTGIVWKEEAL